MNDEPKRGLSSFIDHPSSLIRLSAAIYILHLLLIVKIALLSLTAFSSIFLVGWALVRREIRFSWHILYYPLIVYSLASTVSALAAEHRPHPWADGMIWFKILIFPCAVMLYREVPRLRELAVYAFAIVAGGGSIWGLIQFATLDRHDLEHRISGPSSHVMTYSGILLPLSLVMLILFVRQRKWWQGASCLLSTLTLLLTLTRSVWLGWMVAALVVLLASRARLALYVLPAAILFVTFLPLPQFSRLISVFDLKQSSNFDRVRMLQAGEEMIRDSPLLGVGPANVKEAYALYRKADAPRARPPHLHNNVVQLWAERGILGLASYLLLLGLFVRECIRAWDGPQRIWAEIGIAVVVSLTVAGLFEFNFGDTEVFYMLLNLFAFVAVSVERPEPANEVARGLVPVAT